MELDIIIWPNYRGQKNIEEGLKIGELKQRISNSLRGYTPKTLEHFYNLDKNKCYLMFCLDFNALEKVLNHKDSFNQIFLINCPLSKLGFISDRFSFIGFTTFIDYKTNHPIIYGKKEVLECMDTEYLTIRDIKNSKYSSYKFNKKTILIDFIVKYFHQHKLYI